MLQGKNKKLFKMTILIVAFLHMPTNAMGPVIYNIVENVFPDRTLAEVQTALSFPNFVAPVVALIAAWLITRGILTKKIALCSGLCILGLSAVSIALFHTSFWHLYLSCILLGVATGLFVSNAFGLMFDNFENKEREAVAGYQTSCVNCGGILLSLLGGILGARLWYGGFLLLLLGFPVALLSFFTVPNYRQEGGHAKSSKLRPRVFYYCAVVFVFMMLYVACGQNISTHIGSGEMVARGVFGRQLPVSTMSGVTTAVQMAGGVIAGFFFGRISARLKDYIIVLAMCLMFIGFMILRSFPDSYPATIVAVLLVGVSISFTMPRCVFAVSTLVDETNSSRATSIVTSLAPSLGGFLSPVIITNITVALLGESTVSRYTFVGVLALILGAVVAVVTAVQKKRGTALKA